MCVLQVFKSRDLENEPKTYSSRWYAQDFLDVGDQNLGLALCYTLDVFLEHSLFRGYDLLNLRVKPTYV